MVARSLATGTMGMVTGWVFAMFLTYALGIYSFEILVDAWVGAFAGAYAASLVPHSVVAGITGGVIGATFGLVSGVVVPTGLTVGIPIGPSELIIKFTVSAVLGALIPTFYPH